MQNCQWKTNWVTLGLAVVALASSLAPAKAQEQQHFAYVTNTNGVTWKKEITQNVLGGLLIIPGQHKIASILVPEHAEIDYIEVQGCVNLTNIVLLPDFPKEDRYGARRLSIISADYDGTPFRTSGLRTITCKKTMRDSIRLYQGWSTFLAGGWGESVQWTDLEELPRIEIRTHSTANGKELEIIWRGSNLQIADTVRGEWKDHLGSSPLRFPLLSAKDMQFYRIESGEPPTTEEPPTPQTLGGNR